MVSHCFLVDCLVSVWFLSGLSLVPYGLDCFGFSLVPYGTVGPGREVQSTSAPREAPGKLPGSSRGFPEAPGRIPGKFVISRDLLQPGPAAYFLEIQNPNLFSPDLF